jgi:hypothetical protein
MDSIRTGSADALGVSVEEIAAFYDRYWPRKISPGLPAFARWQFVDAPEQQGRCTVCVSVAGSELVGVMGLHERAFLLNGAVRSAAELTTWIVSPEAKGKGIGPRMLDYLQSTYEVLLGSGISDEALNVYLRKDFNLWRHIPRYFRVWDIDAVRPYGDVSPLGQKLAKHRKDAVVPDAGCAKRVAAGDLPAADRGLADKNGYVRTRAHLAWRYDDHPVYDYETWAVGEAYVVLRRDTLPGMTFAHVVEIGATPVDMPAVLSFLEFYAQDRGLAAMDFTCTASDIGAHLIASGWFSSVDEPSLKYISLFHPPELRDPQTTSLIYWARDAQATIADLGRLHVVKGDLDLDRPTLAYYEANGLEPR